MISFILENTDPDERACRDLCEGWGLRYSQFYFSVRWLAFRLIYTRAGKLRVILPPTLSQKARKGWGTCDLSTP